MNYGKLFVEFSTALDVLQSKQNVLICKSIADKSSVTEEDREAVRLARVQVLTLYDNVLTELQNRSK
jgi:hypothetical protein